MVPVGSRKYCGIFWLKVKSHPHSRQLAQEEEEESWYLGGAWKLYILWWKEAEQSTEGWGTCVINSRPSIIPEFELIQ